MRYMTMCVLVNTVVSIPFHLLLFHQVNQPPEVVEAYRVCQRFEQLLGKDLDFDRAFEATFSKNTARRRAIAIADGEFGNPDFTGIDDATLITAYKRRMQLFYLMLPLASPDNPEEERLFFPPDIKQILDRKPPLTAREFVSYAAQLDSDLAQFRAHLQRLIRQYPAAAARMRKFRAELLSAKSELPKDFVVRPRHDSYSGNLMAKDEAYYEINGFTVVRESGQMRIVRIRLFTKLF